MYQSTYIIFGILSLLAFTAALTVSLKAYKSKGRGKRLFTSLHMFTLGVFVSTVLIFIPVYYTGYDFEDSYAFLRPFLISIHHTFRVFILDGEFDTIRDAVPNASSLTHVLFSLYAAFLYVIAPLLTFSNVLSLFKNIKGEIRFAWHKRRPFYIFSELNERSIVLAESVSEIKKDKKPKKKDEKPVIVFTDVFEHDEEDDYELLLRVHDINAICLKKDITRLNVKRKKGQVEFFLMGDDESENIDQAIKLTEENRDFEHRSIYLFSSKPSAGYILDSIEKGDNAVSESLIQIVKENPDALFDRFDELKYKIDEGFYLRRIDSVELLAKQILHDEYLLETLFKRATKEGRISILLVGLGKYGKQFLKVALWLYQVYGLDLEISIIDSKKKDDLKKSLEQECPEIISENCSNKKGDANYTINFIGRKDCFTSDFDKLFKEGEYQEKLCKTQLAIVALGDDEKNIETAVNLRRLFEYMSTVMSMHSSPLIYSIVYDDKKADSLSCVGEDKSAHGIINHSGTPYDIHFVGSLKSQFSYSIIQSQKEIEAKALEQHLDWVTKTRQLRSYYCNGGYDEFTSNVKAHFAKDKKKYFDKNKTYDGWTETWNDDNMYETTPGGLPDYEHPLKPEKIKEEIEKYFKFEYYRLSSIAKAIHREIVDHQLNGYFEQFDENKEHQRDKKQKDIPICSCKRCEKRRISEHMRWNAYMRVNGYELPPNGERHDLAKIHDLLVPWDALDELEKYKD